MQPTQEIDGKAVLAVALELSAKKWKLALGELRRAQPAIKSVDAPQPRERLEQAVQCIEQFKHMWKLPQDCRVVLVYEAGQDGFWIERALRERGIEVLIADPASIPVPRQAKRAKTDRLDAIMLLEALWRWLRGERNSMHPVRLPTPEAEAHRQLARDRGLLLKEIGQHRDRMRKLLRTVGCWDEGELQARLAAGQVRCWDGQALPEQLHQRLQRECERLELVHQQLAALERSLLAQLPEPVRQLIAQLAQLKGVGWVGAVRLVLELFWRNFRNRRQVGSCVGLVSQPYDSGDSRVDQGISKQGNRKVRALLIEMAWMWLRYQPQSAISLWFEHRTAGNASNKRGKRIAIVAVARRLAIALWHYLSDGTVPEGAQLKKARASRLCSIELSAAQ